MDFRKSELLQTIDYKMRLWPDVFSLGQHDATNRRNALLMGENLHPHDKKERRMEEKVLLRTDVEGLRWS